MLAFVAKVLSYAWKYGVKVVTAVANWVKNNWKTVSAWIGRGLGVTTIIDMIIRILNL